MNDIVVKIPQKTTMHKGINLKRATKVQNQLEFHNKNAALHVLFVLEYNKQI